MDKRSSSDPGAHELMQLQAEALYTHDGRGRLLTVNEPGGGPAPRMFLGRTIQGTTVCRFRHDVPDDLVRRLEALCAEEGGGGDLQSKPRHGEAYMDMLGGRICTMGPAFLVPADSAAAANAAATAEAAARVNAASGVDAAASAAAHPVAVTRQNAELLAGGFDWLIAEADDAQPCMALLFGGRAVSVCRSVRITDRVHEAGLETLPPFRGHGYAAAVVTAWAAAVRRAGRIPLYSTSWDNVSSQRVAQKLRLECYGTDFAII